MMPEKNKSNVQKIIPAWRVGKKLLHFFFPPVSHFFHGHYSGKMHHLFVDTLYGLLALVLVIINIALGIWFFVYLTSPHIDISLQAKNRIISGEKTSYTLSVAPSKDIHDVRARFLYPKGFQTKEGATLLFGDIKKDEIQEVTIDGIYTGEVEKEDFVEAFIEYRYLDRVFTERATLSFTPASSALSMELELPEKVLVGETFDIHLKYKNTSSEDLQNIKFQIDATRNLRFDEQEILFFEIKKKSEGEKTVQATFTDGGDTETILRVIGWIEDWKQGEVEKTMSVYSPRLEIISTDIPRSVDAGQTFSFPLNIKNQGDVELKNIVLHSDEGTDSFDTLAPGEEKQIQKKFTAPSTLESPRVSFTEIFTADAEIDDTGIRTFTSPLAITIPISSRLALDVLARYYDSSGEQLGYGPWPPQAWEITSLRVFLSLSDFTNDLKDITVTAILPGQVEWTGITSVLRGGALEYHPETREVHWHIASLEAFDSNVWASFEVRLLPNHLQIGKNLHLVVEPKVIATDTFTGSHIQTSDTAPAVGPIQP